MTENERVTINGKEVTLYREAETNLYRFSKDAVDMLLEALEEREQYRAIGTIEEFKKIEELFNVISDKVWNYILAGEELLERYEAIGTIEEFKNFKKKSVAKKPRFYAHNYYCIECGNLVGNNEFEWQRFLYCDKCGQKLDWQ